MESIKLLERKKLHESFTLLAVGADCVYGLKSNEDSFTLFQCIDGNAQELSTFAGTDAVAFLYQNDLNSLVVAQRLGEIAVFQLDTLTTEAVGMVEAGITAMEQSPDGELLIFITALHTCIVMTKEFLVVQEFSLEGQEPKVFVNVGWGKKETQFHGSVGKSAAIASKDEESGLVVTDDLLPRITWRGDGEYFAVSFVSAQSRIIKIYNREGALEHEGEKIGFLEQSLSWKPSGNLLASTQKLAHKHDVVFFEKNGLRHGEFTLRDKDSIVHELYWNANSTALAIRLTNNGLTTIQIWGSSNYYYYLKYELRNDNGFSFMRWDPEVPLKIHTLSDNGIYEVFLMSTTVLVSSSLSEVSNGTVAVVDGANLHLTPFKTRNIPPPMNNAMPKFDSNIIAVSFGYDRELEDAAVLLADQSVELIGNISKSVNDIRRSKNLKLTFDNFITAKHLEWVAKDLLLVLVHNEMEERDEIYSLTLKADHETILDLQRIELDPSITFIWNLYMNAELGVIGIESSNGEIFELSKENEHWICEYKAKFPNPCQWVGVVQVGNDFKRIGFIGLTDRNKLYLDNVELAIDCTSFFIHNDYLIISTLEHYAKFVPLSKEYDDFRILESDSRQLGYDEKIRRIELGAKIIIAIPNNVNLVLQMPRGNLETVAPRALVLAKVKDCIDNGNYLNALVLCRKHRIDLNILVDHNPEQFTAMIDRFAVQITNPDYLNLFIVALKNEDVCKTMYPPLSADPSTDSRSFENKINSICILLRGALEKTDQQANVQPILTTFAKQEPPALEAALERIVQIKKNSVEEAESALKYLIFLANVDQLYNVALGIYDFPLVLMVAQYSQKDPREYLPFLNDLKKLEKNYQRFSIDDYLKKYTSALSHLCKCGPERFDELIRYAKKHMLFKDALKLYPVDSKEYTTVLVEFADHQKDERSFDDAGLLYQMAGKYTESVECYVLALRWREAASIIHAQGMAKEPHASSMVNGLLAIHRYADAAHLYIDFLDRPALAVEVFAKGQLWGDAFMTARKYKLDDLVDSTIKPALLAHAHLFVDEMVDLKEKLEKQVLKLRKFRETKEKTTQFGMETKATDFELLSDTASMATTRVTSTTRTGFTGMSSMTGKTGKQRRKMARKRAAGKDKAFEDEYLMKSWKASVEKINSLMPEVRSLIVALLSQQYLLLAESVQKTFRSLELTVKKNMAEVFSAQPGPVMPFVQPELLEDLPKPVVIEPPTLSTDKWWTEVLEYN